MKSFLIFLLGVFVIGSVYSANTRLIILADMGNEPDEEQQMVHMLMYANEFDLEGLIAVTGKYLNPASNNPEKQRLYPDLFHKLIDGYEEVLPNLKLHASGWPDAEYLRSIVTTGQQKYGIDDVGEGKSSPGSELIIKSLLKNDERPVYIVVNAGSNTLAQALFDLKNRLKKKEFEKILSKIYVYENGAQDNAGAWICHTYPQINWIRSNYQTYCYGGPSIDGGANNRGKASQLGPYTWEPYAYNGLGQHQWALEHLKGNHGPLMKLWPIRQFHKGGVSFLEGGGTIPWLGFVNKGLYNFQEPHWGGWSGRFSTTKAENYWSKHGDIRKDEQAYTPFYVIPEVADSWVDPETGDEYKDIYTPVWRWRRAFFNDFACRADWCIKPYNQANHNPVAAVNEDKSDAFIFVKVKPLEEVSFNASDSYDPDSDELRMRWYFYPEAGTYKGLLELLKPEENRISFTIPADAKGTEIHLILEVMDKSEIASMYDYRRIILTVE